MFVRRDFVAVYKQTILGPLWHIIQPILTTLVYTIVFSRIAGLSTDSLPPLLFYMSGIIIWNYFADCLNKTSATFIDNAQIFGKVYFPRLTVPVATVITGLLTFSVQLGFFLLIYAFYFFNGANVAPTWYILTLPYLILLMAILGLGLGIIVSSLTTKYRDLRFLVAFGTQLAMFASPVIYPLSAINNPDYKIILSYNPVAPIIEGFRFALLGSGSFNWWMLGYSTVVAFTIFLFGVALFHRVEKTFMDTV
jgi:lipopolysaccharide transport system permease protein